MCDFQWYIIRLTLYSFAMALRMEKMMTISLSYPQVRGEMWGLVRNIVQRKYVYCMLVKESTDEGKK